MNPSAPQAVCAMCQRAIDPTTAFYSTQGELVCTSCNATHDMTLQEGRAMDSLKAAGYGALAAGCASWLFNPLLFLSISSVLTASGTMTLLVRHPEYRAKLGDHYFGLWGACVLAVFFGGFPLLAFAGFVGGSFL